MSLTDRQLNLISKQDTYDGKAEISDGEGLVVRITPQAKIYFHYRCRFNKKSLRIRIGKYPVTSLKEARRKHKLMMELRESGRNPNIAITGELEFITLDDCVAYWLKHYVPQLKAGTQALYRSFAKNYLIGTFPERNVETIPAREWMQWLDTISLDKPKTANSLFTKLRACLNFCKSKFIIEKTDLDRIKRQHVGKAPEVGTRVPTFSELSMIWLAIERSRASSSNKALHQLTMLWGSRLSELRLARRRHFDMEAGIWTVPKELSKTNTPIRRPIPTKARAILERVMATYDDVLFPGGDLDRPITISAANRYIRRIRDGLPIEDWRTHDFRRSLSTGASELSVMPHVVEKMLGHELGGVLAVYNKHDWLKDQLEGYELYAEKLDSYLR
ncbi:tyrosine-type recombinase/integrase [Photobacterium phosphoreum]|uniref:tyrosine-type recombinase/integrase n=1 Tax=Photobacterium phosphoreum TaxID=659 RepID=UPI000D177F9F|nr:site-specific integrase [Photobacterium phosphoreum]PSU58375.1 integrase [Photobacterium phosphoreum]